MKLFFIRVSSCISVWVVIAGMTVARGQAIHDTTILEERSNMWSRIWGSALDDGGVGVALDNAGNAYVSGDTAGEFDGQTNAGLYDLCLTKYDPDGAKVWTRIWGSASNEYGRKVALDRASNVYVVGSTLGSFGGQTNAGSADFCLTMFTAGGSQAWSRIWGSTNVDSGYNIAVDDLTNIYVVGFTEGAFDGQTNSGMDDLCLTKFDAAGTRQWSRIWGSTQYDITMGVALEPPSASYLTVGTGGYRAASNIYVAGYTAGEFDGQTNAGDNDLCLTKWTAEGTKTWTRIWGSASNEDGAKVTLDSSGNAYVIGATPGEFGGQTNMGSYDICLTKYNSGGTQLWTRIWGSASNDYGDNITLDSAGNPCVLGTTAGSFDGQTNNGALDLCLAKLNTGGTLAWTRIWGSASNEYGRGIAQDAVGHILVAGFTEGAFDGQTNAGVADICLTKWGFTAPGVAPWVSASDGTYTYKVLVSWGAATNAFGYRVWRNTANDSESATELGNATSASYYDTTAVPGTLYYYWVKTTNDVGLSALSTSGSGWRRSQASTDNAPSDMDGDLKKDPALYQETTGDWVIMLSASQYEQQQVAGFGGAGYQAVSGDYDGDSKTDPAIYQAASGTWIIMLSGSSYVQVSLAGFGGSAYTPVPADYDGDGKTDPAIYQEATGTLIVKMSQNSYAEASTSGFGGAGCRPVFGDFDADGKDDPGVYIESGGQFMIMQSGNGYSVAQVTGFGGAGYRPVYGDFDADRKADPAIYQESTGTWIVLMSGNNYESASVSGFGGAGYTAISGDFDQDYKADLAVYQRDTGNWQIKMSGSNYEISSIAGFGGGGYSPVP